MPYARRSRGRFGRDELRGPGTAHFTLCLPEVGVGLANASVAGYCTRVLAERLHRDHCGAEAYCFMPDHLHVLVRGLDDDADMWAAVVGFKSETGRWFDHHRGIGRWQNGFDVSIPLQWEGTEDVARYILNNPVRRALVQAWDDYPHSGTIRGDGCWARSPWE